MMNFLDFPQIEFADEIGSAPQQCPLQACMSPELHPQSLPIEVSVGYKDADRNLNCWFIMWWDFPKCTEIS